MLLKFGEKFTDIFKRIMPDSFVFALLLTLVTGSILLNRNKALTDSFGTGVLSRHQ